MVDIKEMRHRTIERAISLNNFLDEEITAFFDLSAWDASYHMQISRSRDIFVESFLDYTGLRAKFELIKKIIENIGGKVYKGFLSDAERFSKIRNIFAHSIYPTIEEERMPEFQKERVKVAQKDWENMYAEAKELYIKLINEIDDKLYTQEPRQKKYKSFWQTYWLKVVLDREKIITEKEEELKTLKKKNKVKGS